MKTRTDELMELIKGAESRLGDIYLSNEKLLEKRANLLEERRLMLNSVADSAVLKRSYRIFKPDYELPEAPDTSNIDNQIIAIDAEIAQQSQLGSSVNCEILSYERELQSLSQNTIDDSLTAKYLSARFTTI